MRPQLAAGGVVGDHFARQAGGDLHGLFGQEQEKTVFVEDHTAAPFGSDGLPIVTAAVLPHFCHVEQGGVPFGPVTDPPTGRTFQVQAQEKAVGGGELVPGGRTTVHEEEGLALVHLP